MISIQQGDIFKSSSLDCYDIDVYIMILFVNKEHITVLDINSSFVSKIYLLYKTNLLKLYEKITK
jgi:hypothetical protein